MKNSFYYNILHIIPYRVVFFMQKILKSFHVQSSTLKEFIADSMLIDFV